MIKSAIGLFICLLAPLGCSRPSEVRFNGRKSEYLEAKIIKQNDNYRIVVDLPVGEWAAKLEAETYPVIVEKQNNRNVAVWTATKHRLNTEQPFRIILTDQNSFTNTIFLEVVPFQPGHYFIEGVAKVLYSVRVLPK